MVDEYADILGVRGVPLVHETQSRGWFSRFCTIKSAFTLALLLVGYVVCARFWKSILKWQERSYRLSMRRKHGIPDNDHRPFNVAYAAVLRGRQEQEAASRNKRILEQPAPPRNAPTKQTSNHSLMSQHNVDSDWLAGPVSSIPGRFTSTSVDHPLPSANHLHRSSLTTTHTDQYNLSHRAFNSSPPRAGPSRRLNRRSLVPLVNDPQSGIDDDDNNEFNDTKISGDDDEDREWYIPKRGAKRVLGDEEENDDVYQTKKIREKRARKVSLEKNPQVVLLDDDMEIDEEDDNLPELKSISRGKKRDRAEAGSTFGGDDEDSAPEADHVDDIKAARRRRKRRTVAKRKSDVGDSVRGQKRDRVISGEDTDGESEGGVHARVSRKKRGRKSKPSAAQDDEEQKKNGSDISMDDSQASTRSRNRRVGDEWESNGTKYKLGPNYQRLQQALVKKARQKFTMPQDSQHPDRSANLEVFVECWLTDEEYKNAKAQHLLAWQDSPKPSVEPETPGVVAHVPEPPSPQVGKNLLWSSTSTPSLGHSLLQENNFSSQPRQLIARNSYRQSIATSVGLRMNPFEQPHQRRISSAPRIASSYSGSGSPGLVDTTNGSPRGVYKSFSKWEKQDLEAKSMMKMREANKRKEEEKAQKEMEEKECVEREQKEREQAAAARAPPVISFSKPAETKMEQAESNPPTLGFGPPPTAANGPSLPSITVTPPSQAPAKAPGTNASALSNPFAAKPAGNPQFTFGPVQTVPPATPAASMFNSSAANAGAAKPEPPKPSGGFSFPALASVPASTSGASKSEAPKPTGAFSFPAPTTVAPTTNSGFPFAQPTKAAATEPKANGQDGGSLLSRLGSTNGNLQPSTQPATATMNAPAPLFSFKPTGGEGAKPSPFGAPATSQTQSQTAAAAPPISAAPVAEKPKFNFLSPANNNSSINGVSSGASSSSLAGALTEPTRTPANPSPFGFPASKPAEEARKPDAAASPGSGLKFSFPAPAVASAFGATGKSGEAGSGFTFGAANTNGSANNATSNGSTAFSSNANSAVKPSPFASSAGFGGPVVASSSSATPNVFGKPAEKPANNPFGGASSSSMPSNIFGASAGTTNPFGGTSSNAFGAPGRATEAPKTSAAFGATPSSSSTITFGVPTAGKAPEAPKPAITFGSTPSSSPFGVAPNKATEAPKPATTFSFGTPASSSTEAPKPTFSFGSTPAASAPTTGGGLTFKFGEPAKGATTTPQGSPFGSGGAFSTKPTGGPSAFGFGTPATTTMGAGAFAGFGSAPAASSQPQQQ